MRTALTRSAAAAIRTPAAVRALSTPAAGGTFSRQSEVARMPIPTLEETAGRYLKSLEALVSPAEHKRSQVAVQQFISKDGMGPVLQERLHEVDKAAPYSWLEDIWLQKAYLEYRDPSYIYVNWAALIGDSAVLPVVATNTLPPPGQVTDIMLERASGIIAGLLDCNDALNNQTFPTDLVKGQPMCMDQFKNQFGTTRIPKAGADILKYQYPSTAKHILVMYKNHAVKVDVYGADGKRASRPQIAQQLAAAAQAVDASIAANGPAPNVPNLTAADRDLWSSARETLIKDPTNAASLELAEDALFGVCLDVDTPHATLESTDATWANFEHNDAGANRWFDKAISVVFLQNGRMGANCEHTPVDALTTGRLLVESLIRETKPETAPGTSGLPPPEPLQWNVDSSVSAQIDQARADAGKLAADLRLVTGISGEYGGKWIKTLGVSPDAFFQVAMQTTYRRLHGNTVATYESAALRRFQHGRTETIRSATIEAQSFAKLFENPDIPVARKLDAFRHAAKVHSALTAAASNGQGVDRHLLGLRAQLRNAEEADKAALFADPAYALSSTFVLSTSNTSPGDKFRGGFAPVTKHGYGINYALDPTDIKYQISDWRSAKETDAVQLMGELKRTLQDLYEAGEVVLAKQ